MVNGKEQFIAKCGSCHVLARAGSTGVVGPNLDEAFQRARKDGSGGSTFEGVVHRQILYPAIRPQYDPGTGKPLPLMPGKLVEGEDAEDVAAYVAFWRPPPQRTPARSRGHRRQGGGHGRGQGRRARHPGGPGRRDRVHVRGCRGAAGEVTVRSKNDATVDHDIALEGNGVSEKGDTVKDGGVSEFTVTLQAGEYTFFCSVDGHPEAGMEGTLTVK